MAKDYLTTVQEMLERMLESGPTKHEIIERIADMITIDGRECGEDRDFSFPDSDFNSPDYEYIEAWLENAVEAGVSIADVLKVVIFRDHRYGTH